MAGPLVGFFSYSRRDDEVHGRQLSAVREFLSTEVQTLLGRPFTLFQDVESSTDGRPWEPEILEALRRADVLIPVLSPAFFASDWCRRELAAFVGDQQRGARHRAVFPLYFVTADELEHKPSTDELALAVRRFVISDIREFRILPYSSGADDIPRRLAMLLQRVSRGIKEYAVAGREQLPREVAVSDEPLRFEAVLRADDMDARRRILARIVELLAARGYLERDLGAAGTVFRELCENVAQHVGREVELRATAGEIKQHRPRNNEGFYLEVDDPGPGFNLAEVVREADSELALGGREHGLLRASRLGMVLNRLDPHRVLWFRELAPHVGISAFAADQVVPVVFSWTHEAIRINDNIITFQQWERYKPYARYFRPVGPGRSDSFMDLVFDPLLRPGRATVGIEIIGQGWSWCLPATELLREVHAFIVRSRSHLRGAVVYADTDASDQRSIREFARDVDWPFFETLDRARAYRGGAGEASPTRGS